MSQRLNEYFVREAGEYLEQVAVMLGENGAPDSEQLVRLSRGVRGSVQMAGAGGLALVTEKLESSARALHGGQALWSEQFRTLFLDTIAEVKSLLGAVEEWSDAERERVRSLLARWESNERAPAVEVAAGSGEAESRVVPISSLFYDDAGPHVIAAAAAKADSGAGAGQDSAAGQDSTDGADGNVPIDSLLLRGAAAARAALALRSSVDRLVASGADVSDLAPLHEEIFDLLELSIADASA
jgi:chemotaxis protein histidine kinase CheA